MRQTHVAGEKIFIDFSGDGIEIIDPTTGECRTAKFFISVLGASSYTYVEPVFSEDLPTWLGCHVRMFEFIGGVPEICVPDNLKSGVTKPDYYDPEINRSYAELAEHLHACAEHLQGTQLWRERADLSGCDYCQRVAAPGP